MMRQSDLGTSDAACVLQEARLLPQQLPDPLPLLLPLLPVVSPAVNSHSVVYAGHAFHLSTFRHITAVRAV